MPKDNFHLSKKFKTSFKLPIQAELNISTLAIKKKTIIVSTSGKNIENMNGEINIAGIIISIESTEVIFVESK